MFIKNFKKLSKDKLFSCNPVLGGKLITLHKIPVLSIDEDGRCYFMKTTRLSKAINKLNSGLEVYTNGQET